MSGLYVSEKSIAFYCPGCKAVHSINLVGKPVWNWDKNVESPTVTPSLLCLGHKGSDRLYSTPRCHTFITQGKIQYLADCEHHLAGKTIPIPEGDPFEMDERQFDENGLLLTPAPDSHAELQKKTDGGRRGAVDP